MSFRLYGSPLFWRETHRQPRFLMFDGRVIVIIMLCIMHIRAWTVALVLISLFILWFFDRKGISADSILRFLRARFVGKRRTARGYAAERSFVDFGHETIADMNAMSQRISGHKKAIIAIRQKMAKTTQQQSG
ncbi:IcmT/TraK family protein [Paracoccus litorisediminis]|uniref:IcmT/TraK family protein n=1 Tax=Paracoccus litorisediminis TaxID=2006130 RepID=UPI003732E17C